MTPHKRLTIGLLTPYLGNLSEVVWSGIDRAVRERDVDLLYFSRGHGGFHAIA